MTEIAPNIAKQKIGTLAQRLMNGEPGSEAFQKHSKQLTVLAWSLLTEEDRHLFLSRTDPVTLEFDMEPISISAIVRSWDIVMEYPPEAGWDRQFAQDVDSDRQRKKWWKPSPQQELQVRRIHQEACERKKAALEGREPEVTEVLEAPEEATDE